MMTRHDDWKHQAWQAFQQDLPRLYAERPGQWVAYRGTEVLGYGPHQHALYQECFARGLKDEEFIIFCISPIEDEIWTSGILGAD